MVFLNASDPEINPRCGDFMSTAVVIVLLSCYTSFIKKKKGRLCVVAAFQNVPIGLPNIQSCHFT